MDTRRKVAVIVGRETLTSPLQLWEYDATPGGVSVSPVHLFKGITTVASVLAAGQGLLTFQWHADGQPLAKSDIFEGTNSASLAIITLLGRCIDTELTCVVEGLCGQTTSFGARLSFRFLADFNLDGGVDGLDVEEFFTQWASSQPWADANCDGGVDGGDVEAFIRCWQSNCD